MNIAQALATLVRYIREFGRSTPVTPRCLRVLSSFIDGRERFCDDASVRQAIKLPGKPLWNHILGLWGTDLAISGISTVPYPISQITDGDLEQVNSKLALPGKLI